MCMRPSAPALQAQHAVQAMFRVLPAAWGMYREGVLEARPGELPWHALSWLEAALEWGPRCLRESVDAWSSALALVRSLSGALSRSGFPA